jgi:hypothetical protein
MQGKGSIMKIKIITIHCIHNFGSVFQAYALQQFLLGKGHEVEIIDYRPSYYKHDSNPLRTYGGKLLNLPYYLRRKSKFDTFIAANLRLTTKRLTTFKKLRFYDQSADLYIAGGDQLWNDYFFCGRDPAYKLKFVTSGLKISYGTSMGRDNYTPEAIDKLVVELRDFKFISLRERQSVNLLKSRGLSQVAHVADPVLLLDKEVYQKIAVKPPVEKYALLYLVNSSPLLDQAVKYISQSLGLKIAHVSGLKKKCRCDYFLKDLGPQEVLGWLLNADIVISASFHATLFAILFNKNFMTLLPHENTNARITELLDFVGLKQRVLCNEQCLNVMGEPVNYGQADRIIADFSRNSRGILTETLKTLRNQNHSLDL